MREHRPDVALLDIKMPGLDGISAAREISGERLAAVVLVTAFSQRELIEEASDAGVHGYVVKPFERHDLVPAIEVAIARFRAETGRWPTRSPTPRSASRPASWSTGPRAC